MTRPTIIIPAAGMGRRMKSYGPKLLIEIGNQLIIERQLSILKKFYPDSEVILVVGFDADKIYKFIPSYVKIVENEFYDETNVARSLSLGLRAASMNTQEVLVVYGDLVFNENTFNIKSDQSFILVDNKNQLGEYEVGVTTVNNYVSHMSYGLSTKWAHIGYFTGKELSLFREMCFNKDYKKYYGFEIINMVVNNGGKIKTIEPKNMLITDVDTSKDIEQAKIIVGQI